MNQLPAAREFHMLTVTDLSKQFGGQVLFTDANLQFHAGNRYGVVGANGSGKSTFLRILTGEEMPSTGEVVIPKRARVGVLEQDHFAYDEIPILHVVMMGHAEVWAAMAEKEAMLGGPEEDFDVDRYGELEETILRLDGYSLEAKASEILEGMQIPTAVHYEPLSTLSGGFKLRVLLARTLASNPDVLLLDEPNNHLDIVSLAWLESFLNSFAGCAMIVSHDHRFLDNVCTHIVDVDYEEITLYTGNYQAFLDLKALERDQRERANDKREREIADHKAFIARFKAKATKARQANSRQKRMEKIVIEKLTPSSRRHPRFVFPQQRPSGRQVVEAIGLCKSYGDKVVLDDVDLVVNRGERLAIIGPNGIGKSTLLKCLLAEVEPEDGEVTWGHETHTGYFAQDHHEVLKDGEDTVSNWLWGQVPMEDIGQIYARLGAVLFSRDEADKRLATLSGGEAARLALCGIGAVGPNVILLDEPTNHLDLEGIEALAEALKKTESTVIFVSHDRWFVNEVANRILEIRPDGVESYKGSYDEYIARGLDDHLDREAVVEASRRKKRKGAR
ncbi:MAG: ABC-F family ATP-binding cassette domain-containing protein [Deltaproteobacteria bacterium]|nr:MAG: ABC-F family ATP-binding cassette domain-containing protein [Deltaproteobacteria bacterium]